MIKTNRHILLEDASKWVIDVLDPNDEEGVRQWEELKRTGIGPDDPDF